MNNFSKNNKISYLLKASTAPTSITTGADSAELDMSGFNSVTFVSKVDLAAVDGTMTLSVRGSTASGGTFQALSGATVSSTTGQLDGLLVIELDRPTFRYLKARIVQATSDIQHGGIIAFQSDAKGVPTTHSSTSMLQTLVRVVNAAT